MIDEDAIVTTTTTPTSMPSTNPSTSRLTWLAISVTVVLWASAFVAIRDAGHDFAPGSLALGRLVAGSVALTVMVAFVRSRRRRTATASLPRLLPRGRNLAFIAVWGAAWMGGYNLTLNAAERHLDAGTASLLVNIAPVLVAVLAGLILGEGFPRRLVIGVAVAFSGVALIALSTSEGQLSGVGVTLGVASAILYAGSAVGQKFILPRVDALTMTWLGCMAGMIVCLPFAPILLRDLSSAPTSSTLAVVYLGVFPTAIAFSTWGYALVRTTAGRLSAATYAVPPLVIVISWSLLDELPTVTAVVGGAVALLGVAIATLRRRR